MPICSRCMRHLPVQCSCRWTWRRRPNCLHWYLVSQRTSTLCHWVYTYFTCWPLLSRMAFSNPRVVERHYWPSLTFGISLGHTYTTVLATTRSIGAFVAHTGCSWSPCSCPLLSALCGTRPRCYWFRCCPPREPCAVWAHQRPFATCTSLPCETLPSAVQRPYLAAWWCYPSWLRLWSWFYCRPPRWQSWRGGLDWTKCPYHWSCAWTTSPTSSTTPCCPATVHTWSLWILAWPGDWWARWNWTDTQSADLVSWRRLHTTQWWVSHGCPWWRVLGVGACFAAPMDWLALSGWGCWLCHGHTSSTYGFLTYSIILSQRVRAFECPSIVTTYDNGILQGKPYTAAILLPAAVTREEIIRQTGKSFFCPPHLPSATCSCFFEGLELLLLQRFPNRNGWLHIHLNGASSAATQLLGWWLWRPERCCGCLGLSSN